MPIVALSWLVQSEEICSPIGARDEWKFSSFFPVAGPYLQGLSRGSNIVLNFSGRLQTANRVEGPYTDVVGARNP
jgi:hypothetical protein